MKRRTTAQVLRAARREQGITQSQLAETVGCQQSAVSMFESGQLDALSRDTVDRMADSLGVDRSVIDVGEGTSRRRPPYCLKYCPVDDCPSNIPFSVRGAVCYLPTMVHVPRDARTRCRFCGEPLESSCPNHECRRELQRGSHCAACGAPYVPPIRGITEDLETWVADRRTAIRELRDMAGISAGEVE